MIQYFDKDRNIIAKEKTKEISTPKLEKNLMNSESTAMSRPPTTYIESTMRTMDYGQGDPLRIQTTPYTNSYPLVRTIGKEDPQNNIFWERLSTFKYNRM